MSHSPDKKKNLTKIGQRRVELGLTEGELAELVDVTEATIKNWEKKQPAWLGQIIYLVDELNCSLADLMEPRAVAELRENQNLTRRDLANRVGVKENTIAKWESEGLSNLEKLLRLCLALKCVSSPELLLNFFNKKKKPSAPLTGTQLKHAAIEADRQERAAKSSLSAGTPEPGI